MLNYAVISSKDEQLFALEVREHYRLEEYGVNNHMLFFPQHPKLRAVGYSV